MMTSAPPPPTTTTPRFNNNCFSTTTTTRSATMSHHMLSTRQQLVLLVVIGILLSHTSTAHAAWTTATTTTSSSSSFWGSSSVLVPTTTTHHPHQHQQQASFLRMDTEKPHHHTFERRYFHTAVSIIAANKPSIIMNHNDNKLETPATAVMSTGLLQSHHDDNDYDNNNCNIDKVAAKQCGMPWTTSIDPAAVTSNVDVTTRTHYVNHSGDDDDDSNNDNLAAAAATAATEESVLIFMPFWKWQVDFMKQHLTNLRVLPLKSELRYAESSSSNSSKTKTKKNKAQRIYTLTCTSDEYKYIRLTVLDAGRRTQVFTSVWYPDPARGPTTPTAAALPILGCDLLQFDQKRHVCICDFQPLSSTQAAENNNNTTTKDIVMKNNNHEWENSLLKPIRSQYPSLQQPMSGRFYNPADSFFSSQMLLGRCNVNDNDDDNKNSSSSSTKKQATSTPTVTIKDAHNMIFEEFMPAWQQYVQQHVQLVKSMPTRRSSSQILDTLQQQAAYDTYAAARDPAHGLLAAYFGKEFAEQYVYDVLFPLSERPKTHVTTAKQIKSKGGA